MHVVYTGPIDSVDIAELGITAERGKPVLVPDELGARLCEQDCWQQAKDLDDPPNTGSLRGIEVRHPTREGR